MGGPQVSIRDQAYIDRVETRFRGRSLDFYYALAGRLVGFHAPGEAHAYCQVWPGLLEHHTALEASFCGGAIVPATFAGAPRQIQSHRTCRCGH